LVLTVPFADVSIPKPIHKKLPELQELLFDGNSGVLFGIFFKGTPGLDNLAKASALVFHSSDRSVELLTTLVDNDIYYSENETTLFRLDSAVTKCFSNFVKLTCMEYMWKILAVVITELVVAVEGESAIKSKDEDHQIALNISLELDPTKTQSVDSVDVNKLQLQLFTQKILQMIFSTVQKMPP
jgi:hypothetical protein